MKNKDGEEQTNIDILPTNNIKNPAFKFAFVYFLIYFFIEG